MELLCSITPPDGQMCYCLTGFFYQKNLKCLSWNAQFQLTERNIYKKTHNLLLWQSSSLEWKYFITSHHIVVLLEKTRMCRQQQLIRRYFYKINSRYLFHSLSWWHSPQTPLGRWQSPEPQHICQQGPLLTPKPPLPTHTHTHKSKISNIEHMFMFIHMWESMWQLPGFWWDIDWPIAKMAFSSAQFP